MKTSKLALCGALITGIALVSGAQAQTKMMPKMTPKTTMAKPVALTGVVAGNFTGREFTIRANGDSYRIRPLAKVLLKGVRGGDQVRVWGRPSGLTINYANVRVLQTGASSNPEDFNPAPNVPIQNKPNNATSQ